MPTDATVIETAKNSAASGTLQESMAIRAFERVWVIGNQQILEKPLLGFFCSTRCPGDIILQAYDLARALRNAAIPVIGGFHSPMEKECLTLMLRGQQPIAICPARSIAQMRLPTTWRQPLAEQRLLLLSPFGPQYRRPTIELTEQRNRFVAALAQHIFVAYAAPGSKTAALCQELLQQGKQVFVLEHAAHDHLLAIGAQAATAPSLCTATG